MKPDALRGHLEEDNRFNGAYHPTTSPDLAGALADDEAPA